MKVEKPANPTIEVTPFLTQKTTLKLYRDVGKWQVITGEIRAEQSLSGKLIYSIVNTGAYLNKDSQAAFILPSSIMFDKTMKDRSRQEGDLEQLGKIEDGNVAELSFSINTLMSPEQLMEMLDSYDIAVTGMPVYAGELKDFDTPHTVGGGTDYYVPHLTLRPMSVFEENNRLTMWQLYFSAEDKGRMSEHIDYMMSDLKWMTSNIRYYGVDQDKQRLAYLQKEGVQVYGATVTGPVRELEKLKEQPEFREFRLGRIEVWNWEERQ
ncbi:anti-sigma factor C-terminal domain-containing protein [Paenibacillus sp. N3/727]|uniref:anti sigma factor C-terminal domain-containing protein n=1 Tax=Paenibacillus sp. N3/727 TaxID=2925845 RepID=UPI001F536926|nr:anti sigma factor C-terminal domain-containing protein [Paenibacillus sp. N3/727]UNK16983.1 anti-sigma factor C-terminal domain-containing protein [Paenibacillus sp. N3/727]